MVVLDKMCKEKYPGPSGSAEKQSQVTRSDRRTWTHPRRREPGPRLELPTAGPDRLTMGFDPTVDEKPRE